MASSDSSRGAVLSRPSAAARGAGAFDAFICCTPAEASQAKVIRDALEQAGIRCAISPSDIKPGHQPIMILLLTRNTSESEAIESEVGRAVYRGFPLVVMRLDSIAPGKRLAYYLTSRPFHRVDAVSPPCGSTCRGCWNWSDLLWEWFRWPLDRISPFPRSEPKRNPPTLSRTMVRPTPARG